MKRCFKCHIPGEDADIDEHEPLCLAKMCPNCSGGGLTSRMGCTGIVLFECFSCDSTGIQGGLGAMFAARKNALEWYAARKAKENAAGPEEETPPRS